MILNPLSELPLANIGENGGADYIKYGYYYQTSPRVQQCDPELRVDACKRMVSRMKKGRTITQVSVRKRIKE